MSDERDKVTVVTPKGGVEVVLKAWLSGREQRQIRSVFLDQVKLSANNSVDEEVEKQVQEKEDLAASYTLDGSILSKAQDAQIQQVVYSVAGNRDNVLDAVLDMHSEDTEFVVQEIKKILDSTELSEEDKKK